MNYRLENKVEGLRLFANQQVLQEAIYMKSESFGTQLFNTNVYFEQIVPTESDWKVN